MFESLRSCFKPRPVFDPFPVFTAPPYTKYVKDLSRIQNKLLKEAHFAQEEGKLDTKRITYLASTIGCTIPAPSFAEATTDDFDSSCDTTNVGPFTAHIAFAQGKRPTMEDEHIAQLITVSNTQIPLFGVFDGHNGNQASKYLKQNLPATLALYLEKFGLDDVGIWNALKHAFLELDRTFTSSGGSTANIALIIDNHIWIANLGDSRAILSTPETAIQLSEDAKPDNPRYLRSILKRGGFVFQSRIRGDLAIGRAFGDHRLQGTYGCCIPHAPKITKTPIPPNASLLIACDGIWDVATTSEVSHLIQQNPPNPPAAIIAKAYNAHSRDNLSALYVRLS